MTEFLQMAHCCGWISHLSRWTWAVLPDAPQGQKRVAVPITGVRVHSTRHITREKISDICSAFASKHVGVCVRECVCTCVSSAVAWMTRWSMGGQVSCQHVLFGAGGEEVTPAVSGDLIIWWTQQWRGRVHTSLSRAARLIRPSLLLSSGGTYRKYWSYFDRVFSPLHNQQCITATPPFLCTQQRGTTSLDAVAEWFHLSAFQRERPVFAC